MLLLGDGIEEGLAMRGKKVMIVQEKFKKVMFSCIFCLSPLEDFKSLRLMSHAFLTAIFVSKTPNEFIFCRVKLLLGYFGVSEDSNLTNTGWIM